MEKTINTKQGSVLQMATGKTVSELSAKLNIDVSEALTGLKAIQREAKKAVQAIKEVERARYYNGSLVKLGLTVLYNDGINFFPAIIVRSWGDNIVSLQVFTDYPEHNRMNKIVRKATKGRGKGQWMFQDELYQ
jgi:hypothetical protein